MSELLEVELPNGEILEGDLDRMIAELSSVKERLHILRAVERQLRLAIAAQANQETKTRYVRGETRRAKVVMPDDSWDQSKLKEAWNAYPELRDEYLKIERVKVKMREYRKLEKESGPDHFESFKAMVVGANEGPTGLPSVVEIEE